MNFRNEIPDFIVLFFYWQTSDVSPPLVTSCTKDPEAGRPSALEAQPCKRLATKSNPVQVDVSAFGIHFLFIGVSKKTMYR